MNLRHEIFIQEMIAHGNRKEAYLKAYPQSTPAAAYNNACRLLSIPHIRERIKTAWAATENTTIQQLQEDYGMTLADVYEKRVLLAYIIKSALAWQQSETNDDGTATCLPDMQANGNKTATISTPTEILLQPPTVSQILRAIVLDTKLEHGWRRKL